MTLLSIVVVNWNVRDLLRDCLRSVVREMRLPPDAYELIVVDNASADGSVEMLRAEFPDVVLIASPDNLGFAPGCQVGYEQARGEFVLLLNPDTVILDSAIDAMLGQMGRDVRLGIVGSRLLNSDGSFQRATGGAFPTLRNLAWNYLFLARLLPAHWAPPALFLDGDPRGMRPIDWVSGASLMFRRAAVGETIFDPAFFMFGEDMALCDRIARAGWKVRLSADTAIVHHHGKSFAQQSDVAVLATVHKGPRGFFRRSRGPLAGFAYDAILFAGYLVRWPLFALAARLKPGRGHDEMARFSRRYVATMLRNKSL
jgi:N-acetylglucosaminyl-diphospho-decaprenol L-rhamnosyltransferase